MDFSMSDGVRGMFMVAHLGMEGLAAVAADLGYMGPAYFFIGIMLLVYVSYMARKRQHWYKALLLFVPIIAGAMLDEMFDDLSDNLVEKQPLLALLVPLAAALIYAGLCIYLNPGLSHS